MMESIGRQALRCKKEEFHTQRMKFKCSPLNRANMAQMALKIIEPRREVTLNRFALDSRDDRRKSAAIRTRDKF